MMKIDFTKLIALADHALATAQTVSTEIIAAAEHVRALAHDAGEWLSAHETQHQSNVTRLTGSQSESLDELEMKRGYTADYQAGVDLALANGELPADASQSFKAGFNSIQSATLVNSGTAPLPQFPSATPAPKVARRLKR